MNWDSPGAGPHRRASSGESWSSCRGRCLSDLADSLRSTSDLPRRLTATFSPVPELNLLKEFEESLDGDYSGGFSLCDYGHNEFLGDPELIARLIPFAEANGSGSLFALWRLDDRTDLATLPVVRVGEEGGCHLIARDLREFLRFVAAVEGEIWCDRTSLGFRDSEPSPRRDEYIAWLSERFGLLPAEDPAATITAAQAEFGPRFTTWVLGVAPRP